ncbi:DUF1501 domain-containing protein [Pseudosulfitobacter koreensis]|uniref:DUF1501 domain-containing protein n=1 Tax=Pseudosulfitobacter koreensis TaxID=2968472 RepID=A0ABT1Z3M5_9RHOB|nr:DUF1501 domain-containing protein [Pseudosulfitobacter koreense]MCR8827741.1 DUF1501 domain-containing protein [Pseudosulfitobacter koreense]
MTDLSRRFFLTRSAVLGCSLAASPLLTPVTFAAAPWNRRLVVILLRGAMDGLDAVQPYGDPAYAGLRGSLVGGPQNGALDLDGFFALHPGLQALAPMWQAGELGFAHAVSTPYRDKRSHFDGQDLLEAGTDTLQGGVRDGWLNRMLQEVPGVTADTAYAIGLGDLPILRGKAPVANWTPEATLSLSPQAERLLAMVSESDPAMHAALAEAALLSAVDTPATSGNMARDMQQARKGGTHLKIAEFAAKRLREDARVASFSLNGWDTHRAQHRSLKGALGTLADTLVHLKQELTDPVWAKTAVVAMTEFGRTARENGTQGTDHGTGGLMVMAGGAIRGGKVHADWPGLDEPDLYQNRDLMPTRDVRAHAAWIMRAMTGLDRATLERVIFPGLDMGRDPGLLL